MTNLEAFKRGFVACMLWAETDDKGNPLDKSYTPKDLATDALAEITEDCEAFLNSHLDEIRGNLEQTGHDFYLTRNRHGAGFWDGDWPEPAATVLTNDAHAYGTLGLYVGDDGKLYTHN